MNPSIRFTATSDNPFGDWVPVKLPSVAEYGRSRGSENNAFYVGTEDLLKEFQGVNLREVDFSEGVKFNKGDILIGNIRPYLKKLWQAQVSGFCSSDVLVIKPKNINKTLLKYILSSERFFNHIAEGYKGSKMPRGDKKQIMGYAFFIPSSGNEQEKIASFFSTLDEKIRISECKIDNLERLKRGLAQKIFSREIRFRKENKSNYPDWINLPINKIAVVNPRNEDSTFPDDFLYIDLESVSKGVLVKENIISKQEAPSRAQRVVKDGDILFQMVRPYQGNNYFVRKSNIARVASTGYAQIRSTENNSHFIYQSLHQPSFIKKVMGRCTGGAYPAINSSDFSSIEIDMPCIEEQNRISQLFEFLDEKIEISRQSLMKLKALKVGLLQKMFV